MTHTIDASEAPSGWNIIESDGDYLTIRDDENDLEIVVDTRVVLRAQNLTPEEQAVAFRQAHLETIISQAMLPGWRDGIHQKEPLSKVVRKIAGQIAADLSTHHV